MKYISENMLSDFEFHDARFSLDTFNNGCLKIACSYLNIHKTAKQNPHESDMEIDIAHITFEGLKIVSYEVGRAWQTDEKGNRYTNEPQIILSGEQASCRFLDQLKSGTTIFDFDVKDDKVYFIDAIAKDPFFTVCFTFDKAIIAWDNYKKESWYVKRD